MPETINVLPVDDLKPHTESAACLCAPRVEAVEGGRLIVHNSYDGREFFEEDEDAIRQRDNPSGLGH